MKDQTFYGFFSTRSLMIEGCKEHLPYRAIVSSKVQYQNHAWLLNKGTLDLTCARALSGTGEISQSGRVCQGSKEKWMNINRSGCGGKHGEGNVQHRCWQRLLIDLATLVTEPLLEISHKKSRLQEDVVQKTTRVPRQKLHCTRLVSTYKSVIWSGVDRQAGIGSIDQRLWAKRWDMGVSVGCAHLYQLVMKVLLI